MRASRAQTPTSISRVEFTLYAARDLAYFASDKTALAGDLHQPRWKL
jgi:hypothetical protein